MAQIGLQYLICSPLTETEDAATYKDGSVMSYAIKVDLSIEMNEGNLYADNRVVESVKEFKSGKLTLNGDHISYETYALILGNKVEKLESGGEKLTAKGDDEGAYIGVGYYATTIKSGVKKYRAMWLHKVKFGIPNESLETKKESIAFLTPQIEGTIMTDIAGIWKEEATFDTEAAAKAWLDEIADMGGTDDDTE